mmetsp:Transcript_48610/g.155560  ORF Transcript_48610/g.155560 Transcript_48610/m.155560 type:complete len:253 (+) Transcript_48610:278-1036(+)
MCYSDPDAVVGVILATGSNACYVERVDRIAKWEKPLPSSNQMVINIEWGDFASASLPRTEADVAVDEMSVNPGEQLFEKLLSGMYMGEVARHMLLRLAVDGGLFGGEVPKVLREPGGLPTPRLSAIDGDAGTAEAKHWLRQQVGEAEHLHGEEACKVVKEVCRLVRARAAGLAACGIAAVLRKIGRDGQVTPMRRTVVAVDGALFEKYGAYRSDITVTLRRLLGSAADKLELKLANDGSGVGAALLAASATH